MPRYPDASGFLIELRNTIGQSWFNAIVDLSISHNGSRVSEEELEKIWSYLTRVNSYQSTAATTPPIINSPSNSTPLVFLEKISNFKNFKKLSPNLNLEFGKKITLIFGKNGSGKTSLCQALKVLANPVKPPEPLHNVRNREQAKPPSFQYQFKGWSTTSEWNESTGFGSQAQFIKYFDSTVAISNTTGNMRAENAVEVSVFHLELFDFVRTQLTDFQKYVNGKLSAQRMKLSSDMRTIFNRLQLSVNIQVEPFTAWSPESSRKFETWIKELPSFDEAENVKLINLEAELEQLQATTSEQGLIVLNAQLKLLDQTEANINYIINLCETVSPIKLDGIEELLQAKQSALLELSREAFPNNIDSTQHNELIHEAARFTQYNKAENCPLCLQDLSDKAKNLFLAYHQHITSNLQKEVSGLKNKLTEGLKNQQTIKSYDLGDLEMLKPLFQPQLIERLLVAVTTIKSSLPEDGQTQKHVNINNFKKWEDLNTFNSVLNQQAEQIRSTLKTAKESGEVVTKRITEKKKTIGELQARRAVCSEITALLEVCNEAEKYSTKASKFNSVDFTSILRKLTIKGKEAHAQLVLDMFEDKLNNEYIAMSGMTLEQLGVKLTSRGNDQNITVTPKIGATPVHRVLSEGEQKVHSLAVYMAEAITQPYQLLVFDDPVTSFDYNYISNFCERIRDLVRAQQNTQIIILTHNWDFFVNLQTTLNRSGCNNSLSVQVLEDCATVSEYSEKWDDLCSQIEQIVNSISEPSEDLKERLSGLMRRLLERLTNAYVFNEQRHQYKIKSLQDSNFQQFTKLVPLTEAEADELRDLYSNLSPPEHDDVRNFYTSKTKLQFKSWYEKTLSIKNSIESRRS